MATQLQGPRQQAMARGLGYDPAQEAQSESKPVEPEILNDDEDRAYTVFVDAARGLRDAELAVRKAGAVYRLALDALNRAVAPTDAGVDGQ